MDGRTQVTQEGRKEGGRERGKAGRKEGRQEGRKDVKEGTKEGRTAHRFRLIIATTLLAITGSKFFVCLFV
jgi:hypothetical protein